MSERALNHRRTHNLLLIQKLLSLRDAASPFTLIVDSLEQSSKPLLWEYIKRSKVADQRIISISYSQMLTSTVYSSAYYLCILRNPAPTSWSRCFRPSKKEISCGITHGAVERNFIIF